MSVRNSLPHFFHAKKLLAASLFLTPIYFGFNSLFAQQHNTTSSITQKDTELIESYIKSKNKSDIIMFDESNIKRFWIDNHVAAKNDLIHISLDGSLESVELPIQLINVAWHQSCKVDIITEDSNVLFSVSNGSKVISTSSSEEPFLRFNIFSSTFDLCQTSNNKFYIKFSSSAGRTVTIKKIVLSFFDNKNDYVFSPATLSILPKDATVKTDSTKTDGNSFILKGNRSSLILNKKIVFDTNPIIFSGNIKNTGDKPAHVYIGYIAYTKNGTKVNASNFSSAQDAKTMKIISLDESNKKIVLESSAAPNNRLNLALNAKDDFSDLPNFKLIGSISGVKKQEDGRYEVTLNKPLEQSIQVGQSVRTHGTSGTYTYLYDFILEPGKDYSFKSIVEKDLSSVVLSPDKCPKEVRYISPLLLSYSLDEEDNTVYVTDYSLSF